MLARNSPTLSSVVGVSMPSSIAHRYRLVDDELQGLLQDKEERKRWLFLEESETFKGHWQVESFDASFFFDLKDLVGPYKVIAPAKLDEFMEAAEAFQYKVAFFDDPANLMDHYENLNEPPEIKLNSTLPNTVNGLLPFQVRGYNYLKNLHGGVALWSTGTGKTVLSAALTKYHKEQGNFDICIHVAKAHNLTNVQRSLKRLADLDSIVIDGEKSRRVKLYEEVAKDHVRNTHITILNYEKFRFDQEHLAKLLEGQKAMIIWDEMPTKLKTRGTKLYHSVCESLYDTKPPAVNASKKKPSELRQYMLSATPIENGPEDFFNCVRILDPTVYGTVADFHNNFVASYSYFDQHKPDTWHNLDKMGMMASHITHEADKNKDPEIKAQFPDTIKEPYYIDWDKKDRRIYDLLTKKAKLLELEDANVLALIGVMQMVCDAPSMITNSAALREAYDGAIEEWIESGGEAPADSLMKKSGSEVAKLLFEAIGSDNLTDERHTKLATLRELLTETHPNEKVLVYSAFNEGLMPILESKFREWNVSYARYAGTPKQKQAAQDNFMVNPDIQVFLSSDMGSDSLSLEQANIVIHYDLPWKWSTYTQRENRVHRVVSEHDTVQFYTLMMADSIEDRKIEIIQKKQGYHNQIFDGAISDIAASAKMDRSDLEYILTGA